MQDLIKNLENIHSFEELNKVSESFHNSQNEVERALQSARARIQEEQRSARRNKEQEFKTNLAVELCGYHDLNYGSCKMIADYVWESHHSYGTQEVTNVAYSLADFIEQIVKNEYSKQ